MDEVIAALLLEEMQRKSFEVAKEARIVWDRAKEKNKEVHEA